MLPKPQTLMLKTMMTTDTYNVAEAAAAHVEDHDELAVVFSPFLNR